MLSRIQSILRRNGYVIYEEPFRLNIVGFRSKETVANSFDDEIHIFYKVNGNKWNYHVYKLTTDPGTYWLNNPGSPEGTAILAQGQYEDAYALGLHKGLYKALVQVRPVTIMRDYNRNAILDFSNGNMIKGLFGINIHRANRTGTTYSVDANSAGCQVFKNAEDFAVFLELCEMHKKLYGNSFTYTLIDFRAMRRETYRRIAIATTAISSVLFGYMAKIQKQEKKKNRRKEKNRKQATQKQQVEIVNY